MIELDFSRTMISNEMINSYKTEVAKIDKSLDKQRKQKDNMLGWETLPEEYDKKEVERIINVAEKINKNSKVMLVIATGGSALGAKAVINALSLKYETPKTEIINIGDTLSTKYLNEVIKYIEDKDFCINLISKSATTLEPLITFRFFRNLLIEKYGIVNSKDRIIITTGENTELKKLAENEGYETFLIPEEIGGRFSVFTPAGLLAMQVRGIDIKKILKGALNGLEAYENSDLEENIAYRYAVLRYILNTKKQKDIEYIVTYEPYLSETINYIKQLFNESEGKDGKGITTTGALNPQDLHSLGQNIQQGKRNIFETVLNFVETNKEQLILNSEEDDFDNLNILHGKSIEYINNTVIEAVMNSHLDGDVPNILLNITRLDEENIGELLYFFQKAITMYCKLQEVNPFDEPGVTLYKENIKELLKKS